MGQITSGIGLVSGINTADLINQLLAIEARPRQLVERRNIVLTSQQVAFQEINAKLLSLKLSAGGFLVNRVFKANTATSSNENVLKASTTTFAIPGTYKFLVDRLVSTQQVITRGFTDQSTTPVAPAGGTLSFEFGDARLDKDSELAQLNGGNGVVRGKIRITDRSGASAVVDLSRVMTVNDVLNAINNAEGINVSASAEGDALKLTDNTGQALTNLAVAEVALGTTAASLGLLTDADAVDTTLTGGNINTIGASTLLSQLNDGNGVNILANQSDFRLRRSNGQFAEVNLAGAATVGDVLDKISATFPDITATINDDGTGIKITDAAGGPQFFFFEVSALNGSQAASDLGIEMQSPSTTELVGSRVTAGLNSRLVRNLNGGTGVGLGEISITNRAGATTNIDLSSALSIADVITLINDAGAGVTASLNTAGNGLKLTDTTGALASDLIVADVTGTAAADLNLAGSVAAATIDSGNLQFRYISNGTVLATLHGGKGVAKGQILVSDSTGVSATVDLAQGDVLSIKDVIDKVNAAGLQINARVNDTGDGILIEDTGPGTVALKIEESGSTTARDFGLLGEADAAGDDFNGSFERSIIIGAADTLDDVITKIADSGIRISANVINDGSPTNPYRLSLTAKDSGKAGAFIFDDGGLGFGAITLSEARNAVVFYGSDDPARAIAITSATNSLNRVIPGTTIDLTGTSTQAVDVTINKDNSAIIEAVGKFVETFNGVVDTLNKYDKYDSETEERGLLLGDSTVARVRSSIYRDILRRNTDLTGQYTALAQIGITVGSGAKLAFDQEKFRAAMDTDVEAVEALFTFKQTETDEATGETTTVAAGIGVKIDELLASLTDSDGSVQTKVDLISSQIEQNKDRIEQLDAALVRKRARLEAQFVAMEQALASLQSQSSALTNLQLLASQQSLQRS